MKKVVLISMLVAGGLFAASLENSTNDELYKMVANADAKTLSEVAFEIDKRAGKLKFEAKEAKRGMYSAKFYDITNCILNGVPMPKKDR